MPKLPQTERWIEFYNSARNNEVLEPKTTLLLHLASSMALGCHP